MNRYYTFHINLFLSLGIQQSSLLYSMILYLYSFLCVNIRFDLENVDRADIFLEIKKNSQIKHVEARSSLCEGDTYRSTKFPWSALPIPPSALFGGKVKVSISLAWESINPLQFLEITMRMHLQNLLWYPPRHASSAANHPSPPMPPHYFPVAAAGTMHAGSPNRVRRWCYRRNSHASRRATRIRPI